MLLGYGAKVGLGNMRVKAENRMVTCYHVIAILCCQGIMLLCYYVIAMLCY